MWLRIGPSFNGLYPEFAQSRRGVSNHLAAIKGLRRRDPEAVRAAMENDIRDGYRRFGLVRMVLKPISDPNEPPDFMPLVDINHPSFERLS